MFHISIGSRFLTYGNCEANIQIEVFQKYLMINLLVIIKVLLFNQAKIIFSFFKTGAEAKKVYEEANKLLNKLIANKSFVANAVVSFHKCNSNSSDDILIYDENNTHIDTLHGLRQQAVKESADSVFYSISDFIAPVEKKKTDYIGCFAVTILGVEDVCKQFEKSFDDYK